MKNKTFFLTLLMISIVVLSSCAGSRSGYGQRKGYGCPNTVTIKNPSVENKV